MDKEKVIEELLSKIPGKKQEAVLLFLIAAMELFQPAKEDVLAPSVIDNDSENKQESIELEGLDELAKLYGVTKATACKYADEPWFQPAIIFRLGRKLRFDREKALEVAKQNSKKLKYTKK